MTTFRLAHLSDVHLSLEGRVPLGTLLGKRALGYMSWRHRRQHVHRSEVLDALIEDLHAQAVDHIVVTGDLVNLALPEEFIAASLWLKKLGSPRDVTIVPGNHDAYVPRAWRRGWALWQPFMSADDSPMGEPVTFPFIRERGPVTLIGLSSAVPTAPLLASGRIGGLQLDRLRGMLQSCLERDCFRVVLVHHPPALGVSKHHKRLRDGAGLRRLIEVMGAEMLLSGHEHKFYFHNLAGPIGSVPAICVPSASLFGPEVGSSGGYAIYTIERGDGADARGDRGDWRVAIERRGFDPRTARLSTHFTADIVHTSDRRTLLLSPRETVLT